METAKGLIGKIYEQAPSAIYSQLKLFEAPEGLNAEDAAAALSKVVDEVVAALGDNKFLTGDDAVTADVYLAAVLGMVTCNVGFDECWNGVRALRPGIAESRSSTILCSLAHCLNSRNSADCDGKRPRGGLQVYQACLPRRFAAQGVCGGAEQADRACRVEQAGDHYHQAQEGREGAGHGELEEATK